jgi:acetylornithine deacetylase/succinyl-diaminopimelate desuccinylase-like protein
MVAALNRDRFITTLSQLVAHGPRLQNAPSANLVPEESLACGVVEAMLRPLVESGFATLQRYCAKGQESRPSLLVTLPGEQTGSIAFVGAHFDVVPADRVKEHWLTDPFVLMHESDGTLRGRGVTDCLGHVALLTEMLLELDSRGIRPRRTIYVVMIANEEERAIPGIGLEYLADLGVLEPLKDGPVYWLDSADFGPTLGTGGIATWELCATGVAGHSGMPQNCVNALELAMATVQSLGGWFKEQVPPHYNESRWHFGTPSTCKPTMVECDNNKITIIPGQVRMFGDMRITPFYDAASVLTRAIAFVGTLNEQIQRGVELPGFPRTRTAEGITGRIQLVSGGKLSEGIACDLDSTGLQALTRAITEVRGDSRVKPYAMTGSLPLVRDLQRRGFDVQITGFGDSRSYHAPNEAANLSDFEDGLRILNRVIDLVSGDGL